MVHTQVEWHKSHLHTPDAQPISKKNNAMRIGPTLNKAEGDSSYWSLLHSNSNMNNQTQPSKLSLITQRLYYCECSNTEVLLLFEKSGFYSSLSTSSHCKKISHPEPLNNREGYSSLHERGFRARSSFCWAFPNLLFPGPSDNDTSFDGCPFCKDSILGLLDRSSGLKPALDPVEQTITGCQLAIKQVTFSYFF